MIQCTTPQKPTIKISSYKNVFQSHQGQSFFQLNNNTKISNTERLTGNKNKKVIQPDYFFGQFQLIPSISHPSCSTLFKEIISCITFQSIPLTAAAPSIYYLIYSSLCLQREMLTVHHQLIAYLDLISFGLWGSRSTTTS